MYEGHQITYLIMGVGAQNDLGGLQTFARKMTEFCTKNQSVSLSKLRCSQKKMVFTEIETVFLSRLRCSPKKTKKVFTEIETVFRHWCAQIRKLFVRIFDILNRMGRGNRPPSSPPPPTAVYFIIKSTSSLPTFDCFFFFLVQLEAYKCCYNFILNHFRFSKEMKTATPMFSTNSHSQSWLGIFGSTLKLGTPFFL